MACIIDSWVPTASITEWAPSPLVSSLTVATPTNAGAKSPKAFCAPDGSLVFSVMSFMQPADPPAREVPLSGVMTEPPCSGAPAVGSKRGQPQ